MLKSVTLGSQELYLTTAAAICLDKIQPLRASTLSMTKKGSFLLEYRPDGIGLQKFSCSRSNMAQNLTSGVLDAWCTSWSLTRPRRASQRRTYCSKAPLLNSSVLCQMASLILLINCKKSWALLILKRISMLIRKTSKNMSKRDNYSLKSLLLFKNTLIKLVRTLSWENSWLVCCPWTLARD